MNFLYIYLILCIYFVIWFVIGQIKKNNGLIDIAWGMSFIVTAISSLILGGHYELTQWILLIVVIIWGFRLSFYLFKRNWSKSEDFRYQAMRKKWGKNQKIKAFIRVYMLQSVISFIISMPIILTNLYVDTTYGLTEQIILGLGVLVFIIGFVFEVVADKNLADFKKNPLNKGKILTTGVWSLTRHPNYFGEATLWWGIGIISISGLNPVVFIGLMSPLMMTLLLRYVSGVPLLEKKYLGNKDFEAYKQVTPIFIPFIKKKQPK